MSNRSKRRDEIAALLALREREGLTYKELASRCGLSASTLSQWAWRLRQRQKRGFAEVSVVDAPSHVVSTAACESPPDVMIIRIADVTIEVPPSIDEATLARALSVVRSQC